jgi:hypothetical protein
MDINTDMSKTTLMMTIITLAVILSLFVVPNTFAKSSGGDGDSDGGCGSQKVHLMIQEAKRAMEVGTTYPLAMTILRATKYVSSWN